MKKIVIVILLCLFGSVGLFIYFKMTTKEVDAFLIDDFKFKELIPGQKFLKSKNVIQNKLGNPLKVSEKEEYGIIYPSLIKNLDYKYFVRTYQYPDLKIETNIHGESEILQSLSIIKNTYKTFRGVRVGDNLETVFKHYGKIDSTGKNGDKYEYSIDISPHPGYWDPKEDNNLLIIEFRIKQNKVKEIISKIYYIPPK